mgnify:CR=1 FL=1
MIIILEGMKRSGKTTFANRLKELTSLPVYYLNDRTLLEGINEDEVKNIVYGSCHTMVEMAKIIEKTNKGECLIIFDRLHLSELIYGRNIRKYNNERMWIIDKELRALSPICLLFLSETSNERTNTIVVWIGDKYALMKQKVSQAKVWSYQFYLNIT